MKVESKMVGIISTVRRAKFVVASLFVLILASAYALSGCQFTLDGNPDVNLVELRISPQSAELEMGSTLVLTAQISGGLNSNGVTWSISGDTIAHLSVSGATAIYHAPDSLPEGSIGVTITATSSEDPSKLAQCVVTVFAPSDIDANVTHNGLVTSPLSVTLMTGVTQQFSAMQNLAGASNVNWSIVSGPGSISSTGLFTPPDTATDNSTTVIRAQLASDASTFAIGTVTYINAADSIRCFGRDVQPILINNCAMSGCHDGSQGVNLLDYAGTVREVTPGNARASRLYQSITELDRNQRMPPPPHTTLPADQIKIIGQWIDEGAQNTICQ